jgi:hypothetical protein
MDFLIQHFYKTSVMGRISLEFLTDLLSSTTKKQNNEKQVCNRFDPKQKIKHENGTSYQKYVV